MSEYGYSENGTTHATAFLDISGGMARRRAPVSASRSGYRARSTRDCRIADGAVAGAGHRETGGSGRRGAAASWLMDATGGCADGGHGVKSRLLASHRSMDPYPSRGFGHCARDAWTWGVV